MEGIGHSLNKNTVPALSGATEKIHNEPQLVYLAFVVEEFNLSWFFFDNKMSLMFYYFKFKICNYSI